MLAVVAIMKYELQRLFYTHTHHYSINLVSEPVVTNNVSSKTSNTHYKFSFLCLLTVTVYTKKHDTNLHFICHSRGTHTLDVLLSSNLPEPEHTYWSLERGCP